MDIHESFILRNQDGQHKSEVLWQELENSTKKANVSVLVHNKEVLAKHNITCDCAPGFELIPGDIEKHPFATFTNVETGQDCGRKCLDTNGQKACHLSIR